MAGPNFALGNWPQIAPGRDSMTVRNAILTIFCLVAPFTYLNWGQGEPNNNLPGDGGEQCGTLIASDGTWNDAWCGGQKRNSVIECELGPRMQLDAFSFGPYLIPTTISECRTSWRGMRGRIWLHWTTRLWT